MKWLSKVKQALGFGPTRKMKGAVRGRIYQPRNTPENTGGAVSAKSRPVGSISARVYRAETGKWEDLGVISKGEK